MSSRYLHLLTQRNSLILLALGFASGLPLALTSGTLQVWMAVENVDIKTIGFFSLVGQAYVFKFLWSPVMDRYSAPITSAFLGRRRSWLLLTQVLLIISIALMSTMQPTKDLTLLAFLAVFIAFCSASQDIVFDAWKTDVLPASERGNGAAISVLGYRLAMLVSGGLALWLADNYIGWHHIWWLMALMMLPGVIATLQAQEPAMTTEAPRSLEQAITGPLRDFFARNNAWLMLVLIILYKLGDAFAASLSTIFLIRGVGFDAGDVGLINKTLGLAATIIGALLGGVIMQRLSLFRSLLLFGILQAISNLGYWVLSVTDKHLYSMAAAVTVENLCGGLGTAAFVALLMTLCNKSFSATQFALLSALSAIGRVYVGPAAGWFVESWGWPTFYTFSVLAALPGLFLLAGCKSTLEYMQNHTDFPQRTAFSQGYHWALRGVLGGTLLLVLWLITLSVHSLGLHMPEAIGSVALNLGAICLLLGVTTGVTLDLLASRKTHLAIR